MMEEELPEPEPSGVLVPPDRTPPTAVGLALEPVPEPMRPHRSPPRGFKRVLEGVRSAILSTMDVADAIADALTGRRGGGND